MRGLAVAAMVLALGGCARDAHDEEVPVACEAASTAYVRALDAAPAEVRIDGVGISECMAKDATTGDVQRVGATLVETARSLAERQDAVPLGYLVGAARRGAERTQGIHDEIVRRLEQEAGPLARTPSYRRGLRAGHASG